MSATDSGLMVKNNNEGNKIFLTTTTGNYEKSMLVLTWRWAGNL